MANSGEVCKYNGCRCDSNGSAKSVASAVRLDVRMLTIHTSGGAEMMRAAEKSAVETAQKLGLNPPLVLGVTVLTGAAMVSEVTGAPAFTSAISVSSFPLDFCV